MCGVLLFSVVAVVFARPSASAAAAAAPVCFISAGNSITSVARKRTAVLRKCTREMGARGVIMIRVGRSRGDAEKKDKIGRAAGRDTNSAPCCSTRIRVFRSLISAESVFLISTTLIKGGALCFSQLVTHLFLMFVLF